VTRDEKIERAALRVLETGASSSFNENHRVRPWDDSIISTILKDLPKKLSDKLALDVAKRAVEFRLQYGVYGSPHFNMLRSHSEDMYKEVGQKIKLTKENYWSVVDICAINALMPGGQRIGDTNIIVYSKKASKK